MYNVMTEGAMKKSITNLTKVIMDFSIKMISLYVQKTEERGLKKTIKKVKKNVTVTKNSKLAGYGQKRFKECKKIFNDYCNKNRSLIKSLRGTKLEEKDITFYRRKLDEEMNDFHNKLKELHKDTDEMLKEYCVLSIETIEEVEYDMEKFKSNVEDLAEIGIDAVDNLFFMMMDKDNPQYDKMCKFVSFRIVSETQKIITEYVSYPNRLLSFFDKFTK